VPVDGARMSGGGTRSDTWRTILADVLDLPLAGVATAEGAAFGAAVLAAVGVGWFPTVAGATSAMASIGETVEPGADAGAYAELHGLYRQLYPALAGPLHALAEA
jgi:xylulokinase